MSGQSRSGRKLRFGIVGGGRIAQAYIQAFQTTPNAELVAIADSDEAVGRKLGEQANCAIYSSHLDLAESGMIDAVVVSTPPATHGSICLSFLERDIAVLCEKPVSLSAETACALRKTSLARKVLFSMASKFRYVEDVVRARELVLSGVLGNVTLFENTFMSFVDMSQRWNSNPAVSGGGVLIDNGTHSVDIMRYFLGPLDRIHAVQGPQLQRLPVEETVHVTTRSVAGCIGRMDLSWSVNKLRDDYISVFGSEGTLHVGWSGSRYRRNDQSDWTSFGKGYDKLQAFRDQICNFSAAVQGLEPSIISADDAVASREVIQAGYDSLASNTWTRIVAAPELAEVGAPSL